MKHLMLVASAAMVAHTAGFSLTENERRLGRLMRDAGGHNGTGDGRREIDPEQIAADIKKSLEKATDSVKAIAEDALGKAKSGETLGQDAKEKADAALTELNGLKAQLGDIEQKLARGFSRDEQGRTAGERFIEDEAFKAFAAQTRPRGRIVVDVKDISSLTTDAAGSVGALIQPQQASAPPLPQRRMTIRALLASGNTNSNLIEFDREKVFTNNADVVADGATKPQSEIQYEDATAPVRTIAHWMRVNVQTLADAPALRSIIDQRLRYGLAYKEEVQLLTGSGSGQNLNGLVTQATAYAAAGGLTAATPLEVIRLMILQVVLAEFPANGIVMNPIDLAAIELSKDGDGRYLVGDPQGTLQRRLWGLPVVETQAMAVDKALVGAFDMAAQIFDRQDATVEVSTEDQDNFIKNKVTIRAEERLALAVYRPQALVYGDLGRVA
ncbi:MAG TPA: phage major capsid protein [Sphingomicrobium sp.]|jgi:HK97 family phage major capsid protein